MSLKFAIWDIDGTIVDSRVTISDCMDHAFKAHGLAPPGYERTRTIVGLDLFEAIARLAPQDASDSLVREICASYKAAFVAQRAKPDFTEELYGGAVDALEKLVNENWLLGVSTGKSRRGLEAVFKAHNLDQYFDTLWCADDGPGKPDPFMCLEAMGAIGAGPHQTLMIGDAVHDMRMAKAAGIRAIGVSWGFGEESELSAAGADQVLHSFADLNAALERFDPENP